ncbi:MAG: DUF3426 domain-containing protein, partial [Mailhella sp.]|nr:DUF3426 domain-containing protein [Mailhella sp.]
SVSRHVFVLPEAPVQEPLVLGGEPSSDMVLKGFDEDSRLAAPRPAGDGLSLSTSTGLNIADSDDFREEPAASDSATVASDPENEAGLSFDGEESAPEHLDMPKEKSSSFEGAFGLLVCVAIVLGGIWAWNHTNYLDGLKGLVAPLAEKVDVAAEPASLIEKLELRDVRQYQEKNDKLGNLIVIEGKVKNNFGTARELIRLEAELYSEDGKVLASRSQLAGTCLSFSQLKVLDRAELENALNSKPGILASNANVMPGAEVPFMVVFTEIPAGASDFKVRIAEANVLKKAGNLEN